MRLRPYQSSAVESVRALIRAGKRRIVIVAPCGSGKTILATDIVHRVLAKGYKVLFLAHRIELIDQVSAKLDLIGVDHGIIQGDHWRVRPWCQVQIGSVPTLARRTKLPEAQVVFVDECHHVVSESFAKVVASYPPDTVILGLTATPYRLDGRGLGEHFEELAVAAEIEGLITDGYLVPPRTFAPSVPDLRGIRTVAGDYNRRQLSQAMDKPTLVGDVVKTWKHLAIDEEHPRGRTTVLFAVGIEHSRHLVARFREADVAAEHLDADTPEDDRRAILARVSRGETTIVSNCQILTEGWDLPKASCVVMARPTQSRCLYRQMVGRGLRSDPGKVDCMVLDHAGNSLRHGLVTEPEEYSLVGEPKKEQNTVPSVRQCRICFAISPPGAERCVECGAEFPKKKRVVIERAGELRENAREARRTWGERTTPERRIELLAKWIREGRERGYSAARAPIIYKKAFGIAADRDILAKAEILAQNGEEPTADRARTLARPT